MDFEVHDTAPLYKTEEWNDHTLPRPKVDLLLDIVVSPTRGEGGKRRMQHFHIVCELGTLSRAELPDRRRPNLDRAEAFPRRLVVAHDLSESEPALLRLAVVQRSMATRVRVRTGESQQTA